MIKPLSEQVIVITGASSGIGLATAREAARRGAKVVMAARNGTDLEREAERIRSRGGAAAAVGTDVTDLGQVQALARKAVDAYGRIDTWVNNAAVTAYATFKEQPVEDFERIVQTNFIGQVYGAKAALPYLEDTGGALVCVGSVESDRGIPLTAAYSASKHAIKGWIDALRAELMHEGSRVRVTLVKPSSINTPLFEKAKTQVGAKPMPIPPVYEPELAAEGILRAAEGNERVVFIGGAGKAMSLMERASPKLMDLQMKRMGFKKQKTHEPRSADAPNNLYAPVEYDGGVRGAFSGRAKAHSPYQRMAAHSTRASFAAAAGLALMAAAKARGNGTLAALLGIGALAFAGKGLLDAAVED